MKNLFFVLFSFTNALSQVGIGTTMVNNGAILQLESKNQTFVTPRMTESNMNAIVTPLNGAMVFNITEDLPYFKKSNGWTSFEISSNPTIILYKSTGTFATSTSTSYTMPLNASNIISNSASYFSVPTSGVIKVTRGGVYLLSASLSTENLPSGNRSYFLAVYLNGSLVSYLSKSRFNFPSQDYWGTSGSLMYKANAGDEFSFIYFINHNSAGLNTAVQTLSVTKLN